MYVCKWGEVVVDVESWVWFFFFWGYRMGREKKKLLWIGEKRFFLF